VGSSLSRVDGRVLELLARGLTTSEVAVCLSMTSDEARGHLARSITTLGVTSKLEAIVKAAQLGLIRLSSQ